MSDMPDRISEYMSDRMPDRTSKNVRYVRYNFKIYAR